MVTPGMGDSAVEIEDTTDELAGIGSFVGGY
jgi:hypothetical protein